MLDCYISHLADGITYALHSLVITAYAVTLDIIDDIECGELRRFIVRIIIAMIVYEVSLNFLIFKLCFSRACMKYRS
jgi:hypothetical protein